MANEIIAEKASSPIYDKILTPVQAAAVYAAMCSLNNIGALLSAELHTPGVVGFIHVYEDNADHVYVIDDRTGLVRECYASQHEFAVAYGLAE